MPETPFSRLKNATSQLIDNQYLAKGKKCPIRQFQKGTG